jgi:hypothetical protein
MYLFGELDESVRSPTVGCRRTTRCDLTTRWAVWRPRTTHPYPPEPLLLNCPFDGEAYVSTQGAKPHDRSGASRKTLLISRSRRTYCAIGYLANL